MRKSNSRAPSCVSLITRKTPSRLPKTSTVVHPSGPAVCGPYISPGRGHDVTRSENPVSRLERALDHHLEAVADVCVPEQDVVRGHLEHDDRRRGLRVVAKHEDPGPVRTGRALVALLGVHGSAVSNSGVRRTLRMRWSPTCSTSPARATSACS